ncbi:SAM-dependent methyltransferase [Streptomyces sp. NPDC005476]|uniref:SAM-dependent methyltransferase n=1 Tax=Streptomyces sp. NPDC005476 TaxID=3156882 RepID=UPI003456C23D
MTSSLSGSGGAGGGTGSPFLKIDTSKPHPARMYDYFLGGKDNYEVDRDAAEQFIKVAPEVRDGVRANRRFMHRAVRHVVAEGGIRQILDIGTGLPTEPNVHQIAHATAPGTRVAYVDNDPIVSTHSMALMAHSDTGADSGTSVVLADLRDPRAVLDHPDVRRIIDFDRPVALLLVAVVHFLAEADDPDAVIATLRDALPTGSYLVLSHATGDVHEDRREDAASVYKKASASMNLRSRARVLDFFGDFTLLDPGLVLVPDWRPDEPARPGTPPIGIYGGVARKDG